LLVLALLSIAFDVAPVVDPGGLAVP
jgi:hypothetical protein